MQYNCSTPIFWPELVHLVAADDLCHCITYQPRFNSEQKYPSPCCPMSYARCNPAGNGNVQLPHIPAAYRLAVIRVPPMALSNFSSSTRIACGSRGLPTCNGVSRWWGSWACGTALDSQWLPSACCIGRYFRGLSQRQFVYAVVTAGG